MDTDIVTDIDMDTYRGMDIHGQYMDIHGQYMDMDTERTRTRTRR
jgi:hypothetical protein